MLSPRTTRARSLPGPTAAALCLPLALGAFGAAAEGPGPSGPNQWDSQQSRPVTVFQEIPMEQAQGMTHLFAPGGTALPIYMNRWGGTYTQGWNDSSTNSSSIVSNGTAQISEFSGSDAMWDEIMECVTDQFSRFNIIVTDIEPTSGAYIESVVGGTPQQLGMQQGVGGVAPYDPYNCEVIDQAIVYTFAEVYMGSFGAARDICETATQEIAHAMTLDHAMLCEDPMTYLWGCGEKEFQDEYAACGEYEVRDCSCGRPSQNSVQLLYELIGANDGSEPPPPLEDNEPPFATILSPSDGAVLPANEEIVITAAVTDDVGLVSVELYWEFNDITLSCPGQGGGWSCNATGDTFTWTVNPSAGSRSFSVRARDPGGHQIETELVTVWLSEDGNGPPEDSAMPEVTVAYPADNAVLGSNSEIQVVATASDDSGIASVGLIWNYSQDFWPCPFESGAVVCVSEGTTHTWTINVGTGVREYSVFARDLFGNEVMTEQRTIQLSSAPPAPAADDDLEDNDTWDFASPIACGDVLQLHAEAGDDDWFRLSASGDDEVRFAVSGDVADELSLVVGTGPHSGATLAEGSGSATLEVIPSAQEIGLRVRPGAATSGAYTLDVTCVPVAETLPTPEETNADDKEKLETSNDDDGPEIDDGIGCSHTGLSRSSALSGLLMMGLLLVPRRRRRK